MQKASDGMQFGVNDRVNEKSKSVGVKHNLGESKVKLPHVVEKEIPPANPSPAKPKEKESIVDTHETNKVAWMIGAAGLGWWLFR